MQPLTVPELHSKTEKRKQARFIESIERKHGTSINPPKQSKGKEEATDCNFEPCLDDDEVPRKIPDCYEPTDANGRPINQNPEHDRMTNAEIQLQLGNEWSKGVVKKASNWT